MHSNFMYMTATQSQNNNRTALTNVSYANLFTTSFRSQLNQNTFPSQPSSLSHQLFSITRNTQNIRWPPSKMSQYAQDIGSNSLFNNQLTTKTQCGLSFIQNNNINVPQIRIPSQNVIRVIPQGMIQQNNNINKNNNINNNNNNNAPQISPIGVVSPVIIQQNNRVNQNNINTVQMRSSQNAVINVAPPNQMKSYRNNQTMTQQINRVNQGNNNNQNRNYQTAVKMQIKMMREIIAIKQLHFVRRFDPKTDHQMPWDEKLNNIDIDNVVNNGEHEKHEKHEQQYNNNIYVLSCKSDVTPLSASTTTPELTPKSILNGPAADGGENTDDNNNNYNNSNDNNDIYAISPKSNSTRISESSESDDECRADDGYNDSQESKSSDYSLNGEAVEFIPVVNNNNGELLSLLTLLLNDALSGIGYTTLSSIIYTERLVDTEYFAALFQAIQGVFVQVMVDKEGFSVMRTLFNHCNDEQKLVLLINLSCNIVQIAAIEYGFLSIVSIMDTLTTIQQIKCFVDALRRNIKLLGTVEFGVRLIAAYFEKETMKGKMNMVFAILKHTDILIQNEYGWYIFYFLLRIDSSIKMTNKIKSKLQGKYAKYCKQEYSSKVVEECLRHSIQQGFDEKINTSSPKKDWPTIIVQEILSETDDLVCDRYGKHLFHLALLSQVNGDLSSLKDYANIKYHKHIQEIRMKSFYKFGEDIDDDDDEEEEILYESHYNVHDENEMKNVLEFLRYPEFS